MTGIINKEHDISLHVVLFKGDHIHLNYFMDQMIKYLENTGIDYYIAEADNPYTYQCAEFDIFISKPGCVMFTFNNVGVWLRSEQGNIWALKGIKVYTFIQDHPRNYSDCLLEPECDITALCLDRNHIDFIKKYYRKIKDAYFVPNGGVEINTPIMVRHRKIDVIYMGEANPDVDIYPIIPEIKDDPDGFYTSCINILLNNPDRTTEDVIEEYFEERGRKLADYEMLEIYIQVSRFIESKVRRIYKLAGMHALDRAGVHVEIYGGGWEDKEEPYSDNIVIHDRILPQKLLKKLCDAKISLCYTPWFKRGCSEKNFDSMLNGAVCVTDKTEYLKEKYTDGKNIVYFDLNDPEQMAADVKWLLEHTEYMEKIAAEGYNTAKTYDSWEKRYEYICGIMISDLQTDLIED